MENSKLPKARDRISLSFLQPSLLMVLGSPFGPGDSIHCLDLAEAPKKWRFLRQDRVVNEESEYVTTGAVPAYGCYPSNRTVTAGSKLFMFGGSDQYFPAARVLNVGKMEK